MLAAALGDLELTKQHVEADPFCLETRVSDRYFPKQDPRSGGTIYIYQFGRDRTPHQIARDFGHEEVFQFLMRHSPEEVKLAQALELGDEELFRTMMATRLGLMETLSDENRRRLPDAAQNNNTNAVRLM